MRKIRVGIAYEGGSDSNVLLVWVKRVLAEKGLELEDEPTLLTPGTSILGYISAYVKKFEREKVDIALFCTDQDKDPDSRRKQIRDKIEKENSIFLDKTIVAVPSPHIEKWLLIQDSIIKNILGIDGAKPLPHKNESPKTCLISLYSESEYAESQQRLRLEIAEKMDLNYCAKNDAGFGHFLQDTRRVVNNLEMKA